MKRNLAYVSFLLAVGLLGLTGSAFAQSTVFGVSSSTDQVRHEGLAEATGQVVLTSSSNGVIQVGSIITVTYGTNLAIYVTGANVTCSGGWCGGAISVAGAAGQSIVTITFSGAATVPLGGTMTISGIRVNANALPSGLINAQVAAQVPAAFAGTNAITFSGNTSVPVANVNPLATTISLSQGPSGILTCTSSANPSTFEISIVEKFAQALTTLADENGLSGPGSAINGSNILVTFTGVPKGVTLTYNGQGTMANPPAPLTVMVALDTSTVSPQTAAKDNDTLSFLFDVTADNTTAVEALLLDFGVGVPASLPTGLVPNAVTATVSLAPPLPDPQTVPPTVPAFTGTEGAVTAVSISDCVTNLLFPWVAVDAPGGTFDTGMAIANTTMDVFTTGSAVPQAGSCALTGFSMASGSTVTASLGPVVAGGTGTIVLSSVPAFAGFRGYVMAVCQFQNAHGFAFITQDNMTASGTSQGYLGLVIPSPTRIPRNPAGLGFGEFLGN
jgi:hypothetical protein